MTDVVGRGTIELVGDARKLKASIDDAKKSIRTLGEGQKDISAKASQSIDQYIGKLQQQNATIGKSTHEVELYKLALRGATNEQLNAANAALKLGENHKATARLVSTLNTGLIAAAGAGIAAAGGLAALVIHSINAADHLHDLNKTTGISVENLSGLALAAAQSGGDLDGIAASINKLSQNIGKDGEKFRALGISAKDPLEAFKQLADIFVAIEDPQLRAALGSTALGKSWQSAAPLLAEGGKHIGEMVDKGKKLSGITGDMTGQADKFKDSLAELKATSAGFGMRLSAEMLPAFNEIIKAINSAYQESGKLAALWETMGQIGTFLFTDHFAPTRVQIKKLNEELNELELNLSGLKKNAPGGGVIAKWLWGDKAELEAKIAYTKQQIADLLKSMEPPKPAGPKPPTDPNLAGRVKAFVDPGAAGQASQIAKAQLALDLEHIRKAGEATVSAFANAEKIMQAMRAANLIDEKQYYASKLGFLNLNSQAQEDALQKEIDRLRKETFTGKDAVKDRLENAKAIAEVEAKLAKVRADAVANIEVNSIQETAANKKIAQSYIDAAEAAQTYIDTINRQNAREIAGIGRGERFRTNQAGISGIEDKQTTERQRLERDLRNQQITKEQFDTYLAVVNDTYAKEIAAYEKRSATLIEKEGDWLNGANEAMQNYFDASRNVAKQTEELFTHAFQGMEDALVNFVKTGKLDFKSLADSVISNLIRIQIRQQIVGSLSQAAGFGSGWLKGLFGPSTQAPAPVRDSVPISFGGAQAAGGDYLVTKPTLFMAGEAGPERATFSGANKSGGTTINVYPDLRGASAETVNALFKEVRALNASIEPRALNVVGQARRRGAF